MGLRMLLLKLQSQWRDAFHHHCKLRTQLEQSPGAPGKLQPCTAAAAVMDHHPETVGRDAGRGVWTCSAHPVITLHKDDTL